MTIRYQDLEDSLVNENQKFFTGNNLTIADLEVYVCKKKNF